MLASWAIASILMGIVGPFGGYNFFAFHVRLSFWFSMLGAAVITIGAVQVLLARVVSPRGDFWRHAVGSCLVFALLFTPFAFEYATWADAHLAIDVSPNLVPPYEAIFLIALGVSLSVHLLMWLAMRSYQPEQVAARRLMARLPEAMRGQLLRISATDHLVEVVTDAGTTTLRLRFRDAIEEADGVAGLCVHRSHWVARAAISGHTRRNGRPFLQLIDGTDIPVSRTYQPGVEQAGLLG